MAARLSIMRAARQLAEEANVFISVRNFTVINQVGAVSIDAKLSCDDFASTHSATSHYDRQSFVGLAWRPEGESICCGALSLFSIVVRLQSITFTHGLPRSILRNRSLYSPPSPSPESHVLCPNPCAEIYSTGVHRLFEWL